eukprot:CCRYP_021180-RA/>CCRYP_021180-RA protein AED:0.48 eAED:0.70 QI:0/0/0/1/0/0/2/0/115
MTNSLVSRPLHLPRYTSTYLNQPPPLKGTSDVSASTQDPQQNRGQLKHKPNRFIPHHIIPQQQVPICCNEYRSNFILVCALKDQSDKSLTAAFRDVYKYLTDRGFQPKLNVMENQ